MAYYDRYILKLTKQIEFYLRLHTYPNQIIGIISDEDAIIECSVSPAVQTSVINCIIQNSFLEPELQSFLNDPINTCAVGQIALFLGENGGCNLENEAFIELAIEALEDGGKVDFKNKIILESSFANNETLNCVYEKLAADNNPLFRETVGAFIDDPKFNLTFRVGNCVSTDDQCTDDSDPYNIVITFEDIPNSPVQIAQAILHESIHAELARYVELHQSGVDVNDRPYLFTLYEYYKETLDGGDIDHIYMAYNYISPIASALREFDNFSYSEVYYNGFAWDGLRKWDQASPLSASDDTQYETYRSIVNQNTTVCD